MVGDKHYIFSRLGGGLANLVLNPSYKMDARRKVYRYVAHPLLRIFGNYPAHMRKGIK